MSKIGYRKPPVATRFVKGKSGNPKGRPRGRSNGPPFDVVLGQTVVVKEGGTERQVTAAEAFLLYLTKRGLEGDGAAARLAAKAIEEARTGRSVPGLGNITEFTINIGDNRPGSVNTVLRSLGMAAKLDRYRPTAQMALEPWLVQAALARLGDQRLSTVEQTMIVTATRTPHKVKWPVWWSVTSN